MTGFWALARKEVLEQRRTWKFVAIAVVLTIPAILVPTVASIVSHVQNEPQGVRAVREGLSELGGGVLPTLGTFLVIIITMGALAGERATGTAAMTLSKPVTRSAFVSAKLFALALSIFGAIAIASTVGYFLTTILFVSTGLGRFALAMVISAIYLVFIGSLVLFWSAMFSRQQLAAGISFAVFIALNILRTVPHAERYLPVSTPDWSMSIIRAETNDYWPAFGIACGLIVVLSVGSWVVFRRKEL